MNYLYFNPIFCKVYAQFSFETATFLNLNKPSSYVSIYLTDINLSVPKPNTEYLKRSFGYSSAVLWNSLPTQAKQMQNLLTILKI